MNDSSYQKYVVDIDVAQQLYACGFTYPTMFFWIADPNLDTLSLQWSGSNNQDVIDHRFPAPTAMELKERYPNEVWVTINNNRSLVKRKGLFHFTKYNNIYGVSLMVHSDETGQIYEFHREEDTSEANVCGAMFCYIYDNHLDELYIKQSSAEQTYESI